MYKLLVMSLTLFFVWGNVNANSKTAETEETFVVSSLTTKGQEAYDGLRKANMFEESHVGYAGTLSTHILRFNTLLKEKNADSAFKSIIKKGTKTGQLYGLSGIYFTDHEYFKKEIERLGSSDALVMKIGGCIVDEVKMEEIIFSKSENVAIIKPGTTIQQFWENNKKSYVLDIANGGYPALFKSYGKSNSAV